MSARHHTVRHVAAVLAALMIASAALPVVATARPAADGPGPRVETLAKPSAAPAQAPTVVRTVVKEEAVRALPIVLSAAALVIAIGGIGYTLTRSTQLRHGLRGQH